MIFIPRSYGIFYLTVKSLLRHCKKIVLITWLLGGKFYIFNMDLNNFIRLKHFILLSTVYDHCFFYSFATSWDFTYISFTHIIRFYLSGSTSRSQFEIEFGKNSKTYACALKKHLSHLVGLAVHITNFHLT